MPNSKKILKLICLMLAFTLFFSLFNISYADEISDFEKNQPKVVKALTDLLVSLGDGVIHIVSVAIGENITIDKLIYNNVQKVSIDYFHDIDSDDVDNATKEPIKAFMEPVVEKWYAVFFKIATMVYMVVLVYIGIAILISSTAEKKASYKQLFSTWCIGIVILFMFPYVMKYIILANNAFVKSLQVYGGYVEPSSQTNLSQKDYYDVYSKYGTIRFVDELTGVVGEDSETNQYSMMIITRLAAQVDADQNKEGDITLAIVYLILIGQMIAILIMYYKRAFMIAFLITIFPLVAMTYVIDKLRRWQKPIF